MRRSSRWEGPCWEPPRWSAPSPPRVSRRGHPLPTFLVRKEPKGHGTAKLIEGHFPAGQRVALIEDVVTTGSSVLRALAVARGEGATVSRLICVVDREQGGAEAFAEQGVEFRALFKVSELLGG